MIIAVDFDGTLVRHDFPHIGAEAPNAFKVLRKLQEGGHKLILLTMRCGKELQDALAFCADRGVKFWAVNENPEQSEWTSSRKVYAQLYIDDLALGVPKIGDTVDWYVVEQMLYGGALDTSHKHVIHVKEGR
jgi:hypothetical protein